MTRLTLALAVTLALAPHLAAQTQTPDPLPPSVFTASTWPLDPALTHRSKVWVVTNSQPSARQSCRKPSVTPTTLTCKRRLRKADVFDRNDVVALLSPAVNDYRGGLACAAIFFGLAGGTIYGGVLLTAVAVGAAIPIIALGGFIALISTACAMDPGEHEPETILYQQLGAPSTITLQP